MVLLKDKNLNPEIEKEFCRLNPDRNPIGAKIFEKYDEEQIIRVFHQAKSGPPLLPSPYSVFRWFPKTKKLTLLSKEESDKYTIINYK
jgi:hypothetical protein